MDTVLRTLKDQQQAALERLIELLKIPSISTDPAYHDDCLAAAEWLRADLAGMGFQAEVIATDGKPMVLATYTAENAAAPRLLFYGHYDVQPVDPLELWHSPPFEPVIKEVAPGRHQIVARGAGDDKGQLMTFVEACRAWFSAEGKLPCSVTILFEGEEESGGPSLEPFLRDYKDRLQADMALICDTSMWDRETPAITVSLRGLVGEEIIVKAADRDLHSGYYGNAARNPNHVLGRILGDLFDGEGRVTLPGFYDAVQETDPSVLESWKQLMPDPTTMLGPIDLAQPAGEAGRHILEQVWARPSAEVNGIIGGYTGDGFKTVIPAEARAKISFRLVGDMDPDTIRATFRQFVMDRIPGDCTVEFEEHGGSPAMRVAVDHPLILTAQKELTSVFAKTSLLIGAGGSIPVVGSFKHILGLDSILAGFGLDDDRIHSPNEKYELSSFHKGAEFWARFLNAAAR